MIENGKALIWMESSEQALDDERKLLARVLSGESDIALNVWGTSNCIVVPRRLLRGKNIEYAKERSKERGWPITERSSGGGATPQGNGIINVTYAYACPRHPSIKDSYKKLCEPIIEIVKNFGGSARCQSVDGSFCDGEYNVAIDERKVAGTAQRRSWRKGKQNNGAVLFAHALILVDADIERSVAAINHFYVDCNQPPAIDPEAHLNLSAIAGSDQSISLEKCASMLQKRYSEILQSECLPCS